MLRGKTVINLDHDRTELICHAPRERVDEKGVSGVSYKPAAVEVDEEGEGGGFATVCGGTSGGGVVTEPEVAGGVDGDIEGGEGGVWGSRRRRLTVKYGRKVALQMSV